MDKDSKGDCYCSNINFRHSRREDEISLHDLAAQPEDDSVEQSRGLIVDENMRRNADV